MKKSSIDLDVKTIFNEYRDLRKQSIKLVEAIINTRNKYSYLTKEKLQNSMSSAINTSRFGLQFDEDLQEQGDALNKIHERMTFLGNTLSNLLTARPSEIESKLSVDFSLVREVHESMTQQILLEKSIGRRLASYTDSISSESLITMTAAFKYPPYLRLNQVDLIVAS